MGDDEHRAAELAVEAVQQREHVVGAVRVEVAGRLVGQHQRRARQQRTGDRHALLLPTRKLAGPARRVTPKADRIEQFLRTPAQRAVVARALHQRRHHHVVEHAESLDQVVELEHETDRAAAQRGARGVIERARRAAGQIQLAGGRRVEQADHVEQRGLARTRRADQRGELAALQLEVDSVQHFGLQRRADLVGLAQLHQAQHRIVFRHSGSQPPDRAAPRARPAAPPRRRRPAWPGSPPAAAAPATPRPGTVPARNG
ncbi:hypothetical protein GALL_324590 [mine drainage metagenome]|uniref:Uncharacterized protein n=1 Tax=mine drainage metagenome TaxID=410659 RepID=A0A1J5QQ47_9ZZZZ